MKKYFYILILLFSLCTLQLSAQELPDSVIRSYNEAKNFKEKRKSLRIYMSSFENDDSLYTVKILELISFFENQKGDNIGSTYGELLLAARAQQKRDPPNAIRYAMPVLAELRAYNDTDGVLWALQIIYSAYMTSGNDAEGLKYIQEQAAIYSARADKLMLGGSYMLLGNSYNESGNGDSGLIYAQKALAICKELDNDSLLYDPYTVIAESYLATGDYEIALSFLRKSLQYIDKVPGDTLWTHLWINNDFAQAYLGLKDFDSSIYYARRSLSAGVQKNEWGFYNYDDDYGKMQLLRTYEYLYKSYDSLNIVDSANKYYRLAAGVKDSIYSLEKIKAIEAASFNGLLRQQEIETLNNTAEEERKHSLQLAFIALGIVSFILFFLILSRRTITNTKVITFLSALALLLVFEFLNLFLHPFLEKITNHSLLLMLFALVGIAALLIPLHHKLEKWATHKLVEKNKAIRLAEAKRTIEDLETKPNESDTNK